MLKHLRLPSLLAIINISSVYVKFNILSLNPSNVSICVAVKVGNDVIEDVFACISLSGCGLVKSCFGICPNSKICTSKACLDAGSETSDKLTVPS